MKKFLATILSILLAVGMCLGFTSCNDKKISHEVTQEEYDAAFTVQALSNVTICMTGPYWERDHIKSYFYSAGNNFALCSYSEDVQYYGRHYGIANGEEFAYIYGSERLADFSEEQAVWTKVDDPSYYSGKGVNFVFHYRRDFYLLEYDKKTKTYEFESTVLGEKYLYSYYFEDKKLKKFEIVYEEDNYHYVWDFYDYGSTKIPAEIDKSTPEEPSLSLKCIIDNIPYEKGEEVYQNYFTSNEYYVIDNYAAFVSFYTEIIGIGVPFDEETFDDSVILCYYRPVSGSLNFIPIEYTYFYTTNKITRKTTYQPEDDVAFPAVVVAYCIDFVEVPKNIYEKLNEN